jgi:hypothetical protein
VSVPLAGSRVRTRIHSLNSKANPFPVIAQNFSAPFSYSPLSVFRCYLNRREDHPGCTPLMKGLPSFKLGKKCFKIAHLFRIVLHYVFLYTWVLQ